MKKYVTMSLFIFWAVTVAIIVAGLILYNQNTGTITNGENVLGNNNLNNTSGTKSGNSSLLLNKT
ncbi:MAG: hypothetical protein UR90_C0018G0012 [Parcubacteria group bacterium GW2011_GWC1_35_8]|uniref:Uncharacterized protein n=2 Tax=Candidatus Nomuraibacteriota TaxID=1752729 RepID=A0A1F6YWE8_9BACT|nr:MAG: hypothetical protein UR90_C0018G0012 [Parcubacteria group bacterium GW2011_GWC1_35_8]KKP88849.1 MAG: hypothetical protein UR91_C0011G0009 [Candidatus Nomurabacteria bacterium GW2011_GWC2_35_8]OGJ06168.1 MAG: hypothetical protein A2238_02390 [Candidatus Nomurabacteria bacterium RIFOXYA2_FULL_35_9]OGJ10729.1 MAG: hypothetical protein A2456_02755 [Candidatus Nomurabacteria bacterium RIFOXYC2_FULL_36_19]OGJ13922.1 MAG: hypothetical protein A2554_02800 [Candidatus Nomurabacteria bacterium RI